jgi:putative membrane protein
MKFRRHSAVAAMAAYALASGAAAQGDGELHFLADALKGDNSEMMLGQMAGERGSSPALRDYGRTLHDDHAKARERVAPIAQQAGVSITDEPMPEAAQERRKLERLHGQAFDREFARYMVKDHRQDISEFEKQARKRGPAADLARQTLPTLRKHLAMAQRLSRG